MNILLLGDCQSNGNNLLVPEILSTNTRIPYGLLYKDKYFQHVKKWYLKKLIEDKKLDEFKKVVNDINNKGEEISNYLRVSKEISKYLRVRQLERAWPSMIKQHNITNLSFGGRTAIGYLKSLQKYLESNPKPDRILITDHTPTHQVFRLAPNEEYYESSYELGDDFQLNHRISIDEKKQFEIYQKAKFLYHKNPKTIVKRSLRFFKWFLKYLDKNNFQYQLIFFIDLFQENFRTTTSIDCTKYYKEYHKSDGDDPNTKIKLQSSIANHVANLIA